MVFLIQLSLTLFLLLLSSCYSKSYAEVIVTAVKNRDIRAAAFVVAAASLYDQKSVSVSVDNVKNDCPTRQIFIKALKYVNYQQAKNSLWEYDSHIFDEAMINVTKGSCSGVDDFGKQGNPDKYKLAHICPTYKENDQQYLYDALPIAIQTAFSNAVYTVINGDDPKTAAAVSATMINDEISAIIGLLKTKYLNVSSLSDEDLVEQIGWYIWRALWDVVGKIFGQCSYEVVQAALMIINPYSFHKNIYNEVREAVKDPFNKFIMPKISETTLFLRFDEVGSKTFATVAPSVLSIVDDTCQQWATNSHVNSSWNQHVRSLYDRTHNFSTRTP